MNLLIYLYRCWLAYYVAEHEKPGVRYFAISNHGVPALTVLIARDRAAWQLSQFAIEFKKSIG